MTHTHDIGNFSNVLLTIGEKCMPENLQWLNRMQRHYDHSAEALIFKDFLFNIFILLLSIRNFFLWIGKKIHYFQLGIWPNIDNKISQKKSLYLNYNGLEQ
jgi:hypothetical protein